jgi:rhodanese-related sulfurtransferase
VEARPLTIRQAIPHFQRGAGMLDLRSKEAYVGLHVPGAVHLAADEQLSNRIGFVLAPEQQVVLVLEDEKDYEPAVYSLRRVGYDQVIGYLEGGIEAWQAAGLPVTSGDIQDITPQELNAMLGNGSRPVIVDVREPWEYAQGHIPEAVLIPLGQLSARLGELDPAQPVAAICASGSRSQSAAALLGQKGFQKVYNVLNGMYGWQMAGFPVSRNGR